MRRPKITPAVLMLWIAGACLLSPLLQGCSETPVNDNDPASLIKDAQDDINNDHFEIGIDKLRSVKNKFPYSKQALEAELLIADAYFKEESYPEAAAAYETFRDLHPKNDKVGYAMFRVAKSYFNDIPSPITRDLSSAVKALEAYHDFLMRFPGAPQAAEAKSDVAKIRKVLADKELYIGNFYYKRKFYESARHRYEKVLELYPETDAAKNAKERLAKITEKIGPEKPRLGEAPR